MADLTNKQKQEYARTLYLSEKGITQKEIAQRAGVTEATVCGWIKKFGWETMRTSLLTTKEEQLSMMYQQLSEANSTITGRGGASAFPQLRRPTLYSS